MTQAPRGESVTTPDRANDVYTRKVPAVHQANRILFFLAEPRGEPPTLSEICRGRDIHKSKGQALLNTLRSGGSVPRDEGTKTYTLGTAVPALARVMLD